MPYRLLFSLIHDLGHNRRHELEYRFAGGPVAESQFDILLSCHGIDYWIQKLARTNRCNCVVAVNLTKRCLSRGRSHHNAGLGFFGKQNLYRRYVLINSLIMDLPINFRLSEFGWNEMYISRFIRRVSSELNFFNDTGGFGLIKLINIADSMTRHYFAISRESTIFHTYFSRRIVLNTISFRTTLSSIR
jgi:hypothetical protein